MKPLLILPLIALLAAGCSVRRLKVGRSNYSSWRFGNAEKIGAIEFREGTNLFRVEGWQSDQVSMAREVTAAAVSAAVKGGRP